MWTNFSHLSNWTAVRNKFFLGCQLIHLMLSHKKPKIEYSFWNFGIYIDILFLFIGKILIPSLFHHFGGVGVATNLIGSPTQPKHEQINHNPKEQFLLSQILKPIIIFPKPNEHGPRVTSRLAANNAKV